MPIKKNNSDVLVLVLIRPADSLRTILAAALNEWECAFSIYSTVYEVVNAVRGIPKSQPVIMITRPAMLEQQAIDYLQQYFPDLQVTGWIDSNENISDSAIVRTTASGMLTVGHLDQLHQVVQKTRKAVKQPVPNTVVSKNLDPFEYELSDDEVNALLGVE